ncbi:MAG: hypothetical protein MRK00_09750 [Nitrosomonas sp.]|nr:hypothetical protein [Nitrosomonas sp.]
MLGHEFVGIVESGHGKQLGKRVVGEINAACGLSIGNININASALVVDEITVIGSRCGPFDRAIDTLASGQVQAEPLIQGKYRLEQGIDAFNHIQKKHVENFV